MAYETRQHFPTQRIWITNEIIHNPSVNKHLNMQVEFIEVKEGQKDFSVVASGMWLSYLPLAPAFRKCSYLKTRVARL